MSDLSDDAEQARRDGPEREAWLRFGPYLSERQWGTVREDTEHDPNSWRSFPHDHARSRVYRHGEDGIAGLCDDRTLMCLALALWNEHDPILKERYFGLANDEGNHGEDAKEYWFHLDATPTSSYLKTLYKYPQAEFPYRLLVEENARRGRDRPEFELLDTGIFDEHRYFDVTVEYAKAAPDDLVMRVTAVNRGPDAAPLHLLPTLWFRNTWAGIERAAASEPAADGPRPELRAVGPDRIEASHPELGAWILRTDGDAELLFCDNESDTQRLWGRPGASAYPKGGIGEHVLTEAPTVNPELRGTKAAAHRAVRIEAGGRATMHVRLTRADLSIDDAPFAEACDAIIARRVAEADAFHAAIAGPRTTPEHARIMRAALAGMIWGEQHFEYEVASWMHERGDRPFVDRDGRNAQWPHLRAGRVISMPDPWEYPWFAAWDLAFHTLPLAQMDVTAAKAQLELLLDADFLHPNGQIPAYEWNFDDVNPPVHAWAALSLYELDRLQSGTSDREFLKRAFAQLLLNFTWWVNRKDPDGNNVFQGGFLGLDNIGVFDRSSPLPTGGTLEQADGTAWMASYAQAMLVIAAELALDDPSYAPLMRKFAEHYLWIAAEVYGTEGGAALWDDDDRFFYDAVRQADGSLTRLRVRSFVGLMPLVASVTLRAPVEGAARIYGWLDGFVRDFGDYLPLVRNLGGTNANGDRLVSLVGDDRLRSILAVTFDEDEFLSPHGIRSLSKFHLEHPYEFFVDGVRYSVRYAPGESDSAMFGGNSNWRGPVWMPLNVLLIRSLLELHRYHGDAFTIDYPTGSGEQHTLLEIARDLVARLVRLFETDASGRRPSHGSHPMWTDEHWRDHLLFFEYFHGDDGSGVGASHQTGWTGLVATLVFLLGDDDRLMQLLTGTGDS